MSRRQRRCFVAVTAYALAGDRERVLAVGMDDYLSKPITADNLKQVLARVVGKSNKKLQQPQ